MSELDSKHVDRDIKADADVKEVADANLSGMDSDLEAFSHNPADGNFATLPDQTAAITNYLNPRFLSY